MENIKIDEDFKVLLPKLDPETFKQLEENILENGCRDPLVLWGDILVDGHNRFAICTEHGIPFTTVSKEFVSRDEAVIWIISTQVSRRNLSPAQLSYYRGRHYKSSKQMRGVYDRSDPSSAQNDRLKEPTARQIADQYNTSPRTIRRDEKGAEAIYAIGNSSFEAKRMIIDGDVKISKKDLETITTLPDEEVAVIAAQIESGTYKKREPKPPAPDYPGRPVDSIIAGMQPLDAAISKFSGSLYAELHNVTRQADKAKVKTALRAYISMLEELYGVI